MVLRYLTLSSTIRKGALSGLKKISQKNEKVFQLGLNICVDKTVQHLGTLSLNCI